MNPKPANLTPSEVHIAKNPSTTNATGIAASLVAAVVTRSGPGHLADDDYIAETITWAFKVADRLVEEGGKDRSKSE